MLKRFFLLSLLLACLPASAASDDLLHALPSVVLLKGDAHTAFRDPILAQVEGKFMLIYSLVLEQDADHRIYWYTAYSTSTDLQHWTSPVIFTPKSQDLNYSSPGSLTRVGDEWLLSLQTIPMNNVHRGDSPIHWPEDHSRLWTMRTRDFKTWTTPELIRVKGPDVAQKDMGRMIDPFLLQDHTVPHKWWCFFKQRGSVFHSVSTDDRKTWTFLKDPIARGENPEVIFDGSEYVMYYSPENGTGVLRSKDLMTWRPDGPPIVLGQADWPWTETRITAGYVADMRKIPGVGKWVLVCHSMGPGKVKTDANVLANTNILIAWSDDLKTWHWPGQQSH